MFCQIEGGEVVKVIPRPTTIVVNEVTYPRQIFNDKAQLTSLGILSYKENTIDNRFYQRGTLSYSIGSDEVVGTYAKTDKDVDALKKGMLDKVKQIASLLLTRDDWMAVRASEDSDKPMGDDFKTYRANIRKESNDKETEIKALSDLDAIMLYEATPYIETRKNDAGENVESEYPISLTNHYFAEDPLAEDDPSFVSLVKK